MREAGFDGRTVLYVASALLSYKGGPEELQQVRHRTHCPSTSPFSVVILRAVHSNVLWQLAPVV